MRIQLSNLDRSVSQEIKVAKTAKSFTTYRLTNRGESGAIWQIYNEKSPQPIVLIQLDVDFGIKWAIVGTISAVEVEKLFNVLLLEAFDHLPNQDFNLSTATGSILLAVALQVMDVAGIDFSTAGINASPSLNMATAEDWLEAYQTVSTRANLDPRFFAEFVSIMSDHNVTIKTSIPITEAEATPQTEAEATPQTEAEATPQTEAEATPQTTSKPRNKRKAEEVQTVAVSV
jgi:hypothetical protein